MYRCFFLFCIAWLLSLPVSFSQTFLIDSLKEKAKNESTVDGKLENLFALCEQRQSLSTDSLCTYAGLTRSLSIKTNRLESVALSEYYVACCLVKRAELSSAMTICDTYLFKLSSRKDLLPIHQKFRILKAQILVKSNQYKSALAEVYRILRIAETQKDPANEMIARNGIGWIHMEMNQDKEALKWFFSALKVSENTTYHQINANIYSNIAIIYKQRHQYATAEHYISKSLDFARQGQNIFFQANSLSILAGIYIETGRTQLAESLLKEALSIREKIGDPFYIISDMGLLAVYYATISNPKKSIELSHKGIKLAHKYDISSKLPYLYEALAKGHLAAEDYKNYSKTLETIQQLKDSMYEATSAGAKAEMDAKYNLDKKENLIRIQRNDISRKNNQIIGWVILTTMTGLTGLLLFRIFRKNQEIRWLKLDAEQKRLSDRAILSAQEEERKRISRDLHDNVGAYATVLLAGVEKLTSSAQPLEIKKLSQGISVNARKIMKSLQDTIWVLSNDIITITDFIDRFKLYANDQLQQFQDISITFTEKLDTDGELSPSEVLNLFRILQEALQNTIKHASSQHISVEVSNTDKLEIIIKDDGKGFSDQTSSGFGLTNMRHRAKEAGYDIRIISNDFGTEVSLKRCLP